MAALYDPHFDRSATALFFPGSKTPLCFLAPSTKRHEKVGSRKHPASKFEIFKLYLGSDNWGNAAQRLGFASTMKFLQNS